jgi:hypothetical protein
MTRTPEWLREQADGEESGWGDKTYTNRALAQLLRIEALLTEQFAKAKAAGVVYPQQAERNCNNCRYLAPNSSGWGPPRCASPIPKWILIKSVLLQNEIDICKPFTNCEAWEKNTEQSWPGGGSTYP